MYETIKDEDGQGPKVAWQQKTAWFKKNVLGAAPIVGSFFTTEPQQAMKNTLRHVVLHTGGYLGMFCHMYYFTNEGNGHSGHGGPAANQSGGSNAVAEDTAEMLAFMMLGEWIAGATYNAVGSVYTHCWSAQPVADEEIGASVGAKHEHNRAVQ